jgi:AraC family transcriptional regulator, transcriptional activator of pobA
VIQILQNKLQTQPVGKNHTAKASQRISAVFLELLEQQFPTENQHPIRLRYASQYADKLNIHVNHLNRALKETLKKTTTQVISERILQEAKYLLRNSNLSVADVAYALGFTEATHFNNFFRKHTQIKPTKFRAL